jgi:PAS domain S-box-containing protein
MQIEDNDRIAQDVLLDAVAGPAFFVDRDYRYLAFNEANRRIVRDLYGTQPEVGESLLDAVTLAGDREALKSKLDRAFAGVTHSDGAWYGTDKERRRFFTFTFAPVMHEGTVTGVAAVAVDATDLVAARETAAALSGLVEASADAMVTWSGDGAITSWSAGAERLTGFAAEEMLGRQVRLLAPPRHQADFPRLMQAAAAGQRVERFATEVLRKDGTLTPVELTASPLMAEDGTIVGATAVARDVSDLKKVNAELMREREFARTLVENLADGVIACDADGELILMNRVAREAAGAADFAALSLDRPAGTDVYEADGVTPLAPDQLPIVRALRGEHPQGQAFVIKREGVPPRSMSASGDSFYNEAGEKLGAVVVMQDVTRRNATVEALRLSEQKFEAAFRASPDAININRLSDGLYLEINDGFTKQTGYTADDVKGKTSLELSVWDDPADRERLVTMLAVHGFVDKLEARFSGKDGSIMMGEMSARIIDVGGEPCILSVTRDVTEQKVAQAALESSYERLEHMSHDMVRTLGRVVEARDPYTQGHEQRAAELCRQIAVRMGMPEPEVEVLETAALVHDVGKLSVPAEILTKPGQLSPVEFDLIKEHPRHSYDILKDIAFDGPIAELVLQHHERMDGSGYPCGLHGDEIRLAARILAVADVVEAMATHRPYRASLGLDAALEELRVHAEKYDQDVVAAFLSLCCSGDVAL